MKNTFQSQVAEPGAELGTGSNCHRTSIFRDSLFNRIVQVWNDLPLEIHKTATFGSFLKLDCTNIISTS
jgi:hypothetical protein